MRFLLIFICFAFLTSIVFAQTMEEACKPEFDSNGKLVYDVVRFDVQNSFVVNWDKAISLMSEFQVGDGDFASRHVISFKNKLFFIDAPKISLKFDDVLDKIDNTIFTSKDGFRWISATKTPGLHGLHDFALIEFNKKLFILGGYLESYNNTSNGKKYQNKIYSSADGIRWKLEKTKNSFSSRSGATAIIFKDKIYLIGGKAESNLNDVWSSSDGINWKQEKKFDLTRFADDSVHSNVVVFDDKLFLYSLAYDKLFNLNELQKISKKEFERNVYVVFGILNDMLFQVKGSKLDEFLTFKISSLHDKKNVNVWSKVYNTGIQYMHSKNWPIITDINLLQLKNKVILVTGENFDDVPSLSFFGFDKKYSTIVSVKSESFPDDAFSVIDFNLKNYVSGVFYLNPLLGKVFDLSPSKSKTDSVQFNYALYNHAIYPQISHENGGKVIGVSFEPKSKGSYGLYGVEGSYCSFGSNSQGVFDYPSPTSCFETLKEKTTEIKFPVEFNDLVKFTYADDTTRCFKIRSS